MEVLDAHSGTTGRARLGLVWASPGPDRPASVFVKLAPFDERQRRFVELVGLGRAEARFYRDVAAEVPVRVPVVHHAAAEDDARYVMVLEDLEATGSRFPSPKDDDLEETIGALVEALGRLHARYWAHPDLDGRLAWVTKGGRVAFEGGGRFIGQALERFGDEMGPDFRRLAELYVGQAPAIAGLLGGGPPTLIHGDPHLGNLFVDPDGTPGGGGFADRRRRSRSEAEATNGVGFFDWGMVWRATGMRDVAYLLGGSVPAEMRRAHERDWIARYLATLASEGVDLSPDDAWEQYRLLAVYAWASATSTAAMGDRWQSLEIGRGGMARATTAVEDLESVALLESLL